MIQSNICPKLTKKEVLTLNRINFNHQFEQDSLYTGNYIEEIKAILPASNVFLKLSLKEQKKIQEKLHSFFFLERSWKILTKTSPFSFSHLKKLLKPELQKFNSLIHKEIKDDKSYIINFLFDITTNIINNINKIMKKGLRPFTKEYFLDELNFEKIYLNFIIIITNKVYENLNEKNQNIQQVDEASFKYTCLEWLYNQLTGFIFSWLGLDIKMIDHFLFDGKYSINKVILNDLVKVNHQFFFFFEKTGFFISKETLWDSMKKKRKITYTIKNEFASFKIFTQHLPNIVPSEDYTKNDNIIKKMKSGSSGARFSDNTIKSLNLMGQKKMKIQPHNVYLIKKIVEKGGPSSPIKNQDAIYKDQSRYEEENSPQLIAIKKEYFDLMKAEKSVVSQQINKYLTLYIEQNGDASFYKKIGIQQAIILLTLKLEINYFCLLFGGITKKKAKVMRKEIFFQMNVIRKNSRDMCAEIAGFTEELQAKSKELSLLKQDISISKTQLKVFNSMCLFTEVLEGYPLYYASNFDYRLRVYPLAWFWGPTSGYFKHFVSDFETVRLDVKDLAAFMFSLIPDPKQRREFLYFLGITKIFDLNKKFNRKSLKDLMRWWAEFHHNIKVDKTDLYFDIKFQEMELCLCNDFYTSARIEIDQSCSVACFFSLLFNNENLKKTCNMTNELHSGLYDHLMKSENLLLLMPEDNFLYPYFSTNRKFVKYLFMCWGYSQKTFGRVDKIIELLTNIKGSLWVANNQEAIKDAALEIAVRWEEYLENLFPGLVNDIKEVISFVKLITEETGEIVMITPDQTILKWCCLLPGVTKTIEIFNPITGKNQQTKYVVHTEELDIQRMLSTFMPGFVHMLDGSFVREVVLNMFEDFNYCPQTIHDAFLLSPKYFFSFYEILEEIYQTPRLVSNLLEKNLFFPNLKSLAGGNTKNLATKKVAFLAKRFEEVKMCQENPESTSLKLSNSNLLRIYAPEGIDFDLEKDPEL